MCSVDVRRPKYPGQNQRSLFSFLFTQQCEENLPARLPREIGAQNGRSVCSSIPGDDRNPITVVGHAAVHSSEYPRKPLLEVWCCNKPANTPFVRRRPAVCGCLWCRLRHQPRTRWRKELKSSHHANAPPHTPGTGGTSRCRFSPRVYSVQYLYCRYSEGGQIPKFRERRGLVRKSARAGLRASQLLVFLRLYKKRGKLDGLLSQCRLP